MPAPFRVPGTVSLSLGRTAISTVLLLAATLIGAQTTQAYRSIHTFGGTLPNGKADGFYGLSGIVFDTKGNMFGTSAKGGANGQGTIWELTKTGAYSVVHNFGGTITNANGKKGLDGGSPCASVVFDAAGNMYGTAGIGGANGVDATNDKPGYGMIWELTHDGVYKDLHDFGGSILLTNGTTGLDGCYPMQGVTLDKAGNLVGATQQGGAYGYSNTAQYMGFGIVWTLTASGTYKDIHDFGGSIVNANGVSGQDGFWPQSPVTIDANGNMFGTTFGGGANPGLHFISGVVWEITSAGVYRDLHDFAGKVVNANKKAGPDGAGPFTGVSIDSEGNLYGTTMNGGPFAVGSESQSEFGILWEITKSGAYLDLRDFGPYVTSSDGKTVQDGVAPRLERIYIDKSDNLFGVCGQGGEYINSSFLGGGIVWEMTKSRTYKDLHDFGGSVTDGQGATVNDSTGPESGVAFDSAGNMYGCTLGDSVTGIGNIWEIQMGTELAKVSVAASTTTGTSAFTGTVTLATPATPAGTVVNLASSTTTAHVPASVQVLPGQTTATFAIVTSPVATDTPVVITAKQGTATSTVSFKVIPSILLACVVPSASVLGGVNAVGTVKLNGPAPASGWTVTLTSGNTALVGVPATVTIPSRATQANFAITTKPFTANYSVRVSAKLGAVTQGAILNVAGDSVSSLVFNPHTVVGGNSLTGTITMRGVAPVGGWVVKLASSDARVHLPAAVRVPEGTTTMTFTITTKADKAKYSTTITASDALSSRIATVDVTTS